MNRDDDARRGLTARIEAFPGSAQVPLSQGKQPGRAEVFAELLTKTLNQAERPHPPEPLSWEAVPTVKDLAGRRSAPDGPAPRPASPPATEGSVFEASFPTAWLSDLLVADTTPSREPPTITDDSLTAGLGGREDGNLPGAVKPTPEPPRAVSNPFPGQLAHPRIEGGGQDAIRQRPATPGVATPLFEQLSDLWGPGTSGATPGGLQPPAQASPAADTTAEERPYYATLPGGLPDLGTPNDGFPSRPVVTGLRERASGPDPFRVDLDPTSPASSAFAPVLSGTPPLSVGGESSATGAWDGGEAVGPLSPKTGVSSGQTDATREYQAGGPTLDLSRTNELLQQLLDEVRRGGQGFLPIPGRDNNGR